MGVENSNTIGKRWLPPRAPSGHGALARAGFLRVEPMRAALLVLGYALVHGAFELLGEMLRVGAPPLVALLPATGLLLAVLLVTPRRSWPLWVSAAIVAEIVVELFAVGARPATYSMGAGAVRAGAALLTAMLVAGALLRALRIRRPLYFLLILTLGSAFASLVAGAISASIMVGFSDPARLLLASRVDSFAVFLGILFGAPLVLAWTVGPRRADEGTRPRRVELAFLIIVTAMVMTTALFVDATARMPALAGMRAFCYVVLVLPSVWAALRFDMRALSAVLFATAVAVVGATGAGHGPFAESGAGGVEILSRLQWYLAAVGMLVWLLHGVMLERARAFDDVVAHRGVADVLMRIATRMTDQGNEGLDATIVSSLEAITRFTDADRCVLVELDREAETYEETHTWIRPGCLAASPRRRGSLRSLPWAVEQLDAHGRFVLPDLSADLPEGAGILETLRADQRAAVAYVALRFEEQLIGAVGFEWGHGRFHWSGEVIALLHIVGQLFASMLRRQQAAETLEAYQSKLRSMARELSLSDERARRRTATDLHDGIGQNLAVAKIRLGQLAARAAPGDGRDFEVLQELVEDALNQSRNIIADLSPSILYDLGVAAAVRWLAARTERVNDGIQCTVNETGEPWSAGEDSRVAIFRCVRELVHNSVRHADASKISIHVDWRDEDLHVCVSDNGRGFQSNEALRGDFDTEGRGFGLFSLRETVHALGGVMTIDSSPGEGAAVSFAVLREHALG